ncbi:hypothetical protein ACEI25_000840 [Photobacterium damselae]
MYNKILFISILVVSFSTNAMTIDTMLKISDDNGTGVFSITNDLKDPSFIKIKPSKITINNDGELVKNEYTKDNLNEWEIAITQNKVIVEPNRVKNIGVRSLCVDGCDRSQDTVFAIKFLPSPYIKDGRKKASVTINYGYEALFVIPALEPSYKYKISRDDDNILLENKGNSLLRVFVNQCRNEIKSSCSRSAVVLAGRKKTLKLPVNARQKVLNLDIMGYNNSFYKKATLSRSNPIIRS